MKRLIFLSCLLPSLISACASRAHDSVLHYSPDPPITGDYSVDKGIEKAQVKLAEAAVSTSSSLGQLAAMEKVRMPKSKLGRPLDADRIGLGGQASVDWTGPIAPLLSQLATASGYRFRAVGKKPAIPVIVAIDAANKPIADIMRDANLQAGKQADVIVYPQSRLIELRYR